MPRTITVGVPVYRGEEQVGEALRSLQQQTFTDFDVLISVDAGDQASARACEPFLADPRFSLTVQPERLDWHGNVNWLLRQPLGEFFCYRQHDDTSDPRFFEVLLDLARTRPDAAVVYADCQWHGGRTHLETAPSIEGDVLSRLRQHIEQKEPVAVRGLMRTGAVEQAGPIRGDEFRGLSEVFVWLAKLLRWGPFVRVPQPLYHRLDHSENYHKQWFDWPDERKRGSWTTLFTGLMEAAMPVCRTPEERFFFQQLILDRIAVLRPGQTYHYQAATPQAGGELMLQCLRRLREEGNERLLQAPVETRGPELRALETDHERRRAEADNLRSEAERLRAEADRLREENTRLRRRLNRSKQRAGRVREQQQDVSGTERVRRLVPGPRRS